MPDSLEGRDRGRMVWVDPTADSASTTPLRFKASAPLTGFGSVYLAVLQRLNPGRARNRILDELVRDARWRAYVEANRGEAAGIQAGMQMWMGRK